MAQEKDTQMQLKEVLGIRTFDQIQYELSKRLSQQSALELKTEELACRVNPQEDASSYREPLHLLKEF